jgi:choline-glycine betaine transporter
MSNTISQTQTKSTPRFSLDAWAVVIALAAAVLIRAGVIHHIPW